VPPDEPKIATYRAKWDEEYRKCWGLQNQFAEGLDPALVAHIEQTCKRIYRLLTIDGYARIDLRLTAANEVYLIEAKPNPILAEDEDFALSAGKAGLPYPQLIDRIIQTGSRRFGVDRRPATGPRRRDKSGARRLLREADLRAIDSVYA
jgi:D-alanine-D-alanine ligase